MDFKTVLSQRKAMLNRNVLMGILQDCGMNKRTSQVMVALYECGIMEQIGRSGGGVSSGDVIRFTARLERDYGIAPQFAEEGIRIWAEALDARLSTAPQPKAQEQTPPAPAPAQPPIPAPSAAAQEKPFSGTILTGADVHRLGWDQARVVTIPDGVKEIGLMAFSECSNLVDICFPESVTSINVLAFSGCTSLVNVHIPESVTSIEFMAYSGCTGLVNVHIPESVTYIGNYAFSGCTSLVNIRFPDSVTAIGNYAFSACTSLVNIHIPESVTDIGDHAFSWCTSLKQITIPAGCTVGPSAFPEQTQVIRSKAASQEKHFSGTILTKNDVHRLSWDQARVVTIPDGVKEIGERAFENCSDLVEIRIPESVTYIRGLAFSGCTSLVNIRIPENVTDIGPRAFSGCTSLVNDHFEGAPRIGGSAFSGCTSLVNVHFEGAPSIGQCAFYGCAGLKQVAIPAGCTVASSAFPEQTQVIRTNKIRTLLFGGKTGKQLRSKRAE